MNYKGSPTYNHQLQTYGANFDYDKFIPRFTAAEIQSQGLDRIVQAGWCSVFCLGHQAS